MKTKDIFRKKVLGFPGRKYLRNFCYSVGRDINKYNDSKSLGILLHIYSRIIVLQTMVRFLDLTPRDSGYLQKKCSYNVFLVGTGEFQITPSYAKKSKT